MTLLALYCLSLLAAAEPEFELRDNDRVVFIGSTLLEREQNDGYLETLLTSRFAGRRITFRNLAWSGDTVDVQLRPLNFGTLAEHVAAAHPTWIVAGFGTGESFAGAAAVDTFVSNYERLLDQLATTNARLLLVTPVRRESLGPPLPDPAEHNAALARFTTAIGNLAARRNARTIDLYNGMAPHGEAVGSIAWTENGMHLTPAGYRRAALVAERQLGLAARQWELNVDAAAGTVETRGTRASPLRRGNSLRLTLCDELLPVPRAPVETPAADSDLLPPRRVRVAGLAKGTYALQIDGQQVAVADAGQWAAGVELAAGPDFDQVEQLRRVVVDKNFWFFHRWRAHNGEYIYGRRSVAKTTGEGLGNSGNPQFPEEFARLEALVAEQESQIARLAVPVEHEYQWRRMDP